MLLIIDSHVHICGPPLNQEYIKCTLDDGSIITLPFKRADCSVSNLIHAMDAHNIDMAIVNAFTGVITNEQLSQILKKHQERLMGFAWIDKPLDEKKSVIEMENAYSKLGLRGLKLNPGVQQFSPTDPKILPLIKKTAELKIPIFIHMYPWPLNAFDYTKPEHIYILKKRVPDAIILVGHTAYQHFMDLFPLALYPGIYVETSFGLELIANLYGVKFAERFIRRIGIDKVVFGSDWMGTQDGDERIVDNNFSIYDKMNLTEEEKAKILGENIRKVMEL